MHQKRVYFLSALYMIWYLIHHGVLCFYYWRYCELYWTSTDSMLFPVELYSCGLDMARHTIINMKLNRFELLFRPIYPKMLMTSDFLVNCHNRVITDSKITGQNDTLNRYLCALSANLAWIFEQITPSMYTVEPSAHPAKEKWPLYSPCHLTASMYIYVYPTGARLHVTEENLWFVLSAAAIVHYDHRR